MNFAGQSPPWRAEDPAPVAPTHHHPPLHAVPAPAEDAPEPNEHLDNAVAIAARLAHAIGAVVRGKEHETKLVLTALACRGHVFLEDVPGTAKTVLARAIAQAIDGASGTRIQCTPDLLPTDVTGLSIYDQRTREFEFRPGPVVANIVLVDEINRAMPKTQSALLEAMAERQVTVNGETLRLPDPFLIIATANPVEQEGTFPMPEAQLDRFFLRLEPVATLAELRTLELGVEEVYIRHILKRWIVALVRSTRQIGDLIDLGASVRASLALERAARGWALVHGRDHVLPEDVEQLFLPVVSHRLLFAPALETVLREQGREEALRVLYERCLELAPRPEPQQWQPNA